MTEAIELANCLILQRNVKSRVLNLDQRLWRVDRIGAASPRSRVADNINVARGAFIMSADSGKHGKEKRYGGTDAACHSYWLKYTCATRRMNVLNFLNR